MAGHPTVKRQNFNIMILKILPIFNCPALSTNMLAGPAAPGLGSDTDTVGCEDGCGRISEAKGRKASSLRASPPPSSSSTVFFGCYLLGTQNILACYWASNLYPPDFRSYNFSPLHWKKLLWVI